MNRVEKALLMVHFKNQIYLYPKKRIIIKSIIDYELYQENLHKFDHYLLGIYSDRFNLKFKLNNIDSIVIVKVLCEVHHTNVWHFWGHACNKNNILKR